jgi:predicted transcriptional regulator
MSQEEEQKEVLIKQCLKTKKEISEAQILKTQAIAERERISTFLAVVKQEVKQLQSEIRTKDLIAEEKRQGYEVVKKVIF